jgi:pterin-4a-carbinolamine dehydratase
MEPIRLTPTRYSTFLGQTHTSAQGLLSDAALLSAHQAQARRDVDAKSWQLSDSRLQQTFRFDHVAEAQRFVHRVQALSQSRQQLPHIFVDFKAVHIELWTQPLGGLTAQDFELAELIDQAVDMP